MSAPPQRVVLATGNQGKLAEICKLLGEIDFIIVAQSEFDYDPAAEIGETFLANALLKARHACAQTGLIAIADDSGLAVDALDGRPGVHSARFAGDNASDAENIEKLLRSLQHVAEAQRGAVFHCAAVTVFPDQAVEPLIASGEWHGRITQSRRGGRGFGYDPIFFDPERGKCAAEMTLAEKLAQSHRGKAFRQLAILLKESMPGR